MDRLLVSMDSPGGKGGGAGGGGLQWYLTEIHHKYTIVKLTSAARLACQLVCVYVRVCVCDSEVEYFEIKNTFRI